MPTLPALRRKPEELHIRHLVLFDIDGTLLSCGPQVRPIFAGALSAVYGTAGPIDGYDFSGRTDPGIVRDLMSAAGLAEPAICERLPAMRELYLDGLAQSLDVAQMRLLPHVAELLAELEAEPDVVLGLLTGNWARGAAIKLGRFGLERYFAFGGFGDDGFQRHELVPAALARAEEATGVSFGPERTLIVGDSLQDVGCARHHGVATLAVATGWTPAADLAAAGAEWVVPTLAEFHSCFAEFAS